MTDEGFGYGLDLDKFVRLSFGGRQFCLAFYKLGFGALFDRLWPGQFVLFYHRLGYCVFKALICCFSLRLKGLVCRFLVYASAWHDCFSFEW